MRVLSTDKKPRHLLSWFNNRIGKIVMMNGKANLFNQITIASADHAKALHRTQTEKNYTFTEI